MIMLVNCVMLHLSLTQTFNKFFKIKRIKKSMKMSKQWIWNLKKINMDESICCTHTQHHQLYNSGITFFTITHAWNMSTICTLYVAKVEEQANNLHCYCQIMVQIAMPTANHKNLRLYAQLWKESGLDLLVITANASGWSAMNPIEHL